MKEILNRFKSPVAVTAALALAAFVVKEWFGYEIPQWDQFVTLFLALLAAFGIVNNPTDPHKF